MHEALFFKEEEGIVTCLLCPKKCRLQEGQKGLCRVRQAKDGFLYTLNFGRVGAMALDPVEKKPLYHFYPGSRILSLGTVGCNLTCRFCQNWQLARNQHRELTSLSPGALEDLLARDPHLQNQLGVAYTYGEPWVWYEYVLQCAPLVRNLGKKNVLVTNGFINPRPLEKLLPWIDAMNIDVKAFNEDFYRRNCSGSLKPVLDTVQRALQSCHVEITYLVVPGENDSMEEISGLARWLAERKKDIPLHLSRYFPNYKMTAPATSPAFLSEAREAARKYLDYVYMGNLPGSEGSNTYCPCCRHLLILRTGYSLQNHITEERCPRCRNRIYGIF